MSQNLKRSGSRHRLLPTSLDFQARSYEANLVLGSVLGAVAGIVNSVAFVAFGGYVSHISGNATRAAVEYSEGNGNVALVFAISTVCFLAGAILTTVILGGRTIQSTRVIYGTPLLIEAIIIGYIWLRAGYHGRTYFPLDSQFNAGYIYAMSIAMGLQNAVVTHVSGAVIRTTHMTGIVTDMGIAIGAWLVGTYRRVYQKFRMLFSGDDVFTFKDAAGHIPRWWRSPTGELVLFWHKFRTERFCLHLSIFCSFMLGALAGTFGYLRFRFGILMVPVVVLSLISVHNLYSHLLLDDSREDP